MKERADNKMTGRVWTQRAHRVLGSPARRHRAASVLDRHQRRRAGRDHAPVRLRSCRSRRWTSTRTTSRRTVVEVAFQANIDKTGTDPNYDIITIPACGCKPPKDVTTDSKADDGEPRYSPDGKTLAFVQQRIKFFYADRARLMLLDRATGKTKGITEDFDRSVNHVTWMPDSRSLVASIDDAGTLRDVSVQRVGRRAEGDHHDAELQRAGARARARSRRRSRSARASPNRRRWCGSISPPASPRSSRRSTIRSCRISRSAT